VCESVDSGMGEGVIGGTLGIGAAETEAFGGLEHASAILEGVDCFFDS